MASQKAALTAAFFMPDASGKFKICTKIKLLKKELVAIDNYGLSGSFKLKSMNSLR